jgi:nucleoside recognition membrane protein YjiH
MRANIIMGLLFLVSLVLASPTGNSIKTAANQFKTLLCDILPIVIMIAFVFGAIAYGISQVLPGDQRARVQQVGAVAIVTAVIAAIIYVLGPEIIKLIASNLDVSCS